MRDQQLDAHGLGEGDHAADRLQLAEDGTGVGPRRGVLAVGGDERLLVQLDHLHVLTVDDGDGTQDLCHLPEDRADLVVAHALDAARRDLAPLVGHERLERPHAELVGEARDLLDLRLAGDDRVEHHVHEAPGGDGLLHLRQHLDIRASGDDEGQERGHAAGDRVAALAGAVAVE